MVHEARKAAPILFSRGGENQKYIELTLHQKMKFQFGRTCNSIARAIKFEGFARWLREKEIHQQIVNSEA
jgi:uncharacterized Fe-S cluster-containing radical SAM superfamily enzyme